MLKFIYQFLSKTAFLILGSLVLVTVFSDLFDPIMSIINFVYVKFFTPIISQNTGLMIRDMIILITSTKFAMSLMHNEPTTNS